MGLEISKHHSCETDEILGLNGYMGNQGRIQVMFWRSAKVKKYGTLKVFLNTEPYGVGNFKTLQFSSDVTWRLLTIREYRLLLFLAIKINQV